MFKKIHAVKDFNVPILYSCLPHKLMRCLHLATFPDVKYEDIKSMIQIFKDI